MGFIKPHKNARDITGKKFGRLTALGIAEIKKYPNGSHQVRWLCQCDCGQSKIVALVKLTSGRGWNPEMDLLEPSRRD